MSEQGATGQKRMSPSPARSSAGGAHAPLAPALFRGAAPPHPPLPLPRSRGESTSAPSPGDAPPRSSLGRPPTYRCRTGGAGAGWRRSKCLGRRSTERRPASTLRRRPTRAVPLSLCRVRRCAQACAGVPRSRDGTRPSPSGRSIVCSWRRRAAAVFAAAAAAAVDAGQKEGRARGQGPGAGSGSGEGDPGCPSAGASGHDRLLDGWVVRARDSLHLFSAGRTERERDFSNTYTVVPCLPHTRVASRRRVVCGGGGCASL